MKTHLAWIRVTAAAAMTVVGLGGNQAAGQYVPYPGVPQYSNVAPYGAQPQQQPPAYQPVQPQPAQQAVQQQPVQQQAYQPAQQSPYPVTQQYQPPQYQAPQYTAVAARPRYSSAASKSESNSSTNPAQAKSNSMSPSMNSATSGNMYSGSMMGSSSPTSAGAIGGSMVSAGSANASSSYGANFTGYSFGGEEAATNGAAPYPSTDASNCDCNDGSYYSNVGTDYGVSGYLDSGSCGRQWFGGVYYLFMSRDNPDYRRFTVEVDTPPADYYPTADVTVLSSPHADHDYRSGFELRFGSTLLNRSSCDTGCDPYGYGGGCNSYCAPEYAWEIGYWYLDDDINTVQVIDSIPTDADQPRLYGMKNFAGSQYNGLPVNYYYDYQVPVNDSSVLVPTDARILAQRVRSNFKAQNLELNLIRLPLCGGVSSYGVGSSYGGCAPACGSPFSMTTLCGFRYLRVDDDFEYASMWSVEAGGVTIPPAYTPWDGANELFYDVNVDNHLAGFQLGANMNYAVSCRCNVFWNTDFGLYNNHMESSQQIYGELGYATFTQSGEDVNVNSEKDDVAFVGEMRIGATYDFSCNWRGLLAYRAIAVSGVALSVDQMPEDFSNEEEIALIDSDGSLVIHGLQVGVECRY
jgi:hypothetical protein